MRHFAAQVTQSPALDHVGQSAHRDTPFLHQSYTTANPAVPYRYLPAASGPAIGSAEFRLRMRSVGDALRASRVGAVYLVHSAFAAHDSSNILWSLARNRGCEMKSLARVAARLIDVDVRDAGNYTPRYAELLETALGGQVPVRLVSWSSENHHLGRADAAIRLLDELAALELPAGDRVAFWGHGHAGNVFAIMSQLLSAEAAALEQFFAAAAVFYRWPLIGAVDIPVWQRVRQLLTRQPQRLLMRPCDFVTFGTPIRYGWRLRESDGLLHFIHHRPSGRRPHYLAVFPSRPEEVEQAAGGDYVQQLGIAGTDSPPSPLMLRSWLANRRLQRLLAPDDREDHLAERLAAGVRVPDCGSTLLIDYGRASGSPAEHLAGHAVYTRPEWLLFQAEQIAAHLFDGREARHAA